MTFTYESDLTNKRDLVRFHSGDTVEDESLLSDEIITSLLDIHDDDWKLATRDAIEFKINKLNTPTFDADWLKVDPSKAVAALEKQLERFVARYIGTSSDLPTLTATIKPTVDSDTEYT